MGELLRAVKALEQISESLKKIHEDLKGLETTLSAQKRVPFTCGEDGSDDR